MTAPIASQLRTIAAWPESFVRTLPAWGDDRLPPGNTLLAPASLQQHGLLDAEGALTPLGRMVRYHLNEFRWQEGRGGFDGLLSLANMGPAVRVLDVGCGAGQTLRRLGPHRPAELVGIDVDAAAIALGNRLSAIEDVRPMLTAASATSLPFCDGTFDVVLTRVALNYMPQRIALTEMTRVLRPGGMLFCRVERIWYDLFVLRSARTPRSFAGRAIELGWGTVHALTGWQPTPGRKFLGNRAFASAYRLRRTLSGLGCTVTHSAESPSAPTLLNQRTQLVIVARKDTT